MNPHAAAISFTYSVLTVLSQYSTYQGRCLPNRREAETRDPSGVRSTIATMSKGCPVSPYKKKKWVPQVPSPCRRKPRFQVFHSRYCTYTVGTVLKYRLCMACCQVYALGLGGVFFSSDRSHVCCGSCTDRTVYNIPIYPCRRVMQKGLNR